MWATGLGGSALASPQAVTITPAQAERIGRRLWQNEAGGSVAGLTAWNAGENFASLGIGHFIWYPEGQSGPFEESFPRLLTYLREHGVTLPAWLQRARGCPWPTRGAFLADQQGSKMKALRRLLAEQVGLEAQFAVERLRHALPKMLEAAPPEARERVRQRFAELAASPQGQYALVDYVNFKGEGTSPTERYQGQGWGLLQVLTRTGDGPVLDAFSRAAEEVLTERVRRSPPERHEARWLAGWVSRVRTYRAASGPGA
ncbi:MAG: hypothetical protein JO069_14795 [Verrucomicrobia bacterium]|nr:hypothetical protein [Verrucomicrobiota bacterium]